MAKTEKVVTYPYPSRFGSHTSMVVAENEDGTVKCKDEFGDYITFKNRLDDNCADSNRYAESRLVGLFSGKKKEEEKK
jgi:class 3 adenylate cyclase